VSTAIAALPLAMLRAGEAALPQRGRLLDRNGIVLAQNSAEGMRTYPFEALAAHLIGHVSRKDKVAWKGVAGVEQINDETLSQGRDVNLTLDARIQFVVENALWDAGVARGAAVVLDCSNGDLLASASLPSFDPNHFIPQIQVEKFKSMSRDKAMPFANRSISATTPGSTFKLLTALAECRVGKADEILECRGYE
jgi:penicillin-binding protein 2